MAGDGVDMTDPDSGGIRAEVPAAAGAVFSVTGSTPGDVTLISCDSTQELPPDGMRSSSLDAITTSTARRQRLYEVQHSTA